MSGIYIPMEMPKEGFVEILIRDDGIVQQTGQSYRVDGTDYITPYVGEMPVIYKAIPVPDHGDLIDRKPLVEFIKEHWDSYDQWFVDQLEARPTIIPDDHIGEANEMVADKESGE